MDPTGGLADLRERRIRILHPLSFVEDPTRTFRAVRFAVRLACRLEPTTARLLRAAARLGGLGCYPALSGARLRAELEAGLAEADPARVLAGLGQVGAFRLLDPDFRLSRRAEPRLRASVALAERAALTSELRLALLVLALTADRRPARTTAWAERLDLAPALRRALVRSAADAPGILADLRGVTDAADAHARLHQVPELTAAWARLLARGARSCRFLDLRLGPWRTARPLLSGDDVLALGVQPGPTLGALLTAARGEQAAGRIRTREDALRWAQAAVARTISAASGPESTPG